MLICGVKISKIHDSEKLKKEREVKVKGSKSLTFTMVKKEG